MLPNLKSRASKRILNKSGPFSILVSILVLEDISAPLRTGLTVVVMCAPNARPCLLLLVCLFSSSKIVHFVKYLYWFRHRSYLRNHFCVFSSFYLCSFWFSRYVSVSCNLLHKLSPSLWVVMEILIMWKIDSKVSNFRSSVNNVSILKRKLI